MINFTEKNKVDMAINNATGATVTVYAWPNFDMAGYERADFMINAFGLSAGTATGAVNIFQAGVYTATAATSTTLTAISSATVTFGSTLSSVLGITGAQALTFTFNTASTGSTISLNGKGIKVDGTQANASYEFLGGTGVSNATQSSAFCALINSTLCTFSSILIAATESPAGASYLSSNAAYVRLKNPGSTTLSATGYYGATANKGVLVKGDYTANVGVPAEKMKGARYITIGCKSSGLAVPFSVNLIRSGSRYPITNQGLAANVNIGTTTT